MAEPSQATENTERICAREAAAAERRKGIPSYLLAAISLVETGRWDENSRENVAWPWTVTARGEGRYFASKRDAITRVYELWDAGVENIDVGCMQVNLQYHGRAFANLDEALDPTVNANYAAQFLKELKTRTRSWAGAAAQYHSTAPAKNRPYKRKVMKLWKQQRREARQKSRRERTTSRTTSVSKTASKKISQRYSQKTSASKEGPEITGRGLVATWRNKGSIAAANQALRQRAQIQAKDRKKLQDSFAPAKKAPKVGRLFAGERQSESQAEFTGRGLNFFRARRLSLDYPGS